MKRLFPYLVLLFLMSDIYGQSVTKSRHNLSVTGIGEIKSNDQSEICIFCHTSHSGNPKSPMWNRNLSGATYTLYDSSTLDAKPGQPDGSSMLCLSCHDGTIALGNTYKSSNEFSVTKKMSEKGNLGTDLSDDHPISFEYNKALAVKDNELKDPSDFNSHILDKNGKLQCTSCHDSHEDLEGNFLRRSNEFSDLCFSCHDKQYWANSSHKNATNKWNGNLPDPWAHLDTSYQTVEQNGCSNCHDVHNAEGNEFLMKKSAEEENCLDCHNGNTAESNILEEFSKPYRHDVYAYTDIHDPLESDLNKTRHVECSDCHNSHAARNTTADAPFIKGANFGVKGINLEGAIVNPAVFEYEICFRCHGDSPVTREHTPRYLGSANTREDFNPQNLSYHPVIEEGKNVDPRGLINPYNSGSKLYCSSCHASDGRNTSDGPHGSIYPRILKANYNMEKTPQLGKSWPMLIQSNFALCFECHEVNTVTTLHTNISGGHFMETLGCNTCHDPHGYQGGTYSENRYGINFDRTVIQPNPLNGKMIDLDQKKCFMTCHDPRGVVNYTHSAGGADY